MRTSLTIVDQLIGSAPFLCEGDFTEGIRYAASLGYDGVELHYTNPADADVPALKEALKENGLAVTAFGTGRAYVNEGFSLIDPDDTRREAAVERLEQFVVLAGQFGAKVIVGCMRGNLSAPEELPDALGRLASSMKYLDGVAAAQGVDIVFEPINRYENNFLCTMAEISDFIRKYGLTNTGILIDTFHMNIEEADMEDSIRSCAPEIRYVHIADSNRRYPGQGHTDFPMILRTLKEIGYEGTLSAECLPWPDGRRAAEGWILAVRGILDQLS